MGTPETSREPCPDRILDDVGGAFAMGAVGGSVFHFIKGSANAPKGERFLGGFQTMRMSAPRTGGGFAVWGGLFSTFDCSMVYLRQKEDPWNSIFAGAATGGFLSMRQGLRASARSAAFGGVLLAFIEGVGIMINRMTSPPPQIYEDPNMLGYGMGGANPQMGGGNSGGFGFPGQMKESDVGGDSGGSGWFGGWFGGGDKKKEGNGSSGSGSSGSEAKVLESFDSPPIPNFDYK
ncbi:mitochondrial import inner membrane translocase subunit TIM17-2-like [Amaranthus tricolor]|uniref:mitochondrial import inner membrane translocase subunit TIM17-2-like n=1 Tax=Amaranthus tricolor TaxID=29722 RepID=UPI002583AD49|nr:mitochondrial import inner membrane translocase subunit TIM17-2-like [Amaranthus tricolor]XP_057537038.1 mitochondrial import inner membrane translocase subunit TIM17-2-like [Amaranthus tricolor]XP_057537365.1 mitochondrial import inner membrane translocase subunit TIM17-2-like [Amaranthus tricolor]XP_057537366.1 mitochondrial import inner membrane translocase subunit TIM17-2-like [Amaranthus tricolor]